MQVIEAKIPRASTIRSLCVRKDDPIPQQLVISVQIRTICEDAQTTLYDGLNRQASAHRLFSVSPNSIVELKSPFGEASTSSKEVRIESTTEFIF